MDNTIGFIGLGDLGQSMARTLLNAGYKLKVYNRTAQKAQAFAALGAEAVPNPSEVLTPGSIVISVVADDAALESVVMSAGFLANLGPNGIHLSMSTVSPVLSQKLADLHAEYGSLFVEAPVFGRPEAAAARQLWICVAGRGQNASTTLAGRARVRHLRFRGGAWVGAHGQARWKLPRHQRGCIHDRGAEARGAERGRSEEGDQHADPNLVLGPGLPTARESPPIQSITPLPAISPSRM